MKSVNFTCCGVRSTKISLICFALALIIIIVSTIVVISLDYPVFTLGTGLLELGILSSKVTDVIVERRL